VTKKNLRDALKTFKNGSAAGLDGATYKMWKAIENIYMKEKKAKDATAFSAMTLLAVLGRP
jgi:hypothetical protein